MSHNKIIFFILFILLGFLYFLSKQLKEGFSDFDDKIDIKSLDDRDFQDNQGGTGIFKDKFASHEILDLHKLRSLKYGKLDNPLPFYSEPSTKIQELMFLEQLKDTSRVGETQFKETKLLSLYPAQIREGQPYNVGRLTGDDVNTLDVRKNTEEILNRQYDDFNKNTDESKITEAQKFTKLVKDAENKFYNTRGVRGNNGTIQVNQDGVRENIN